MKEDVCMFVNRQMHENMRIQNAHAQFFYHLSIEWILFETRKYKKK